MSEKKSGDDRLPGEMVKLGRYAWPANATRQTISHLGERFWAKLTAREPPEVIVPEGLGALESPFPIIEDQEALRSLLCDMLDRTYLDWAGNDKSAGIARACIVPPADFSILQEWAGCHDFTVLSDLPSRETLEDVFRADAGLLVIPDLGRMFHRTFDGLDRLRALLEAIVRSKRKVLVGAWSWTWQFLRQAVHVELAFSDVRTFPAFDADALAHLLETAKNRNYATYCLRSGSSGEDVFARNEDGDLKDPFFHRLSEWSFGIPWIAFEMMASSVRRVPQDDDDKDGDDDDENGGENGGENKGEPEPSASDLWIWDWEPTPLPDSEKRSALFVLHALLIHGALQEDQLFATLPRGMPRTIIPALEQAGILRRRDGRLSCAIGFYPMVRKDLSAAGFPLDRL